MTANEGLVVQYVREAEAIVTASQIKPGYDLAGEADRWVLKVRAHADALPADQGSALVARVAGRLSIQIGATLDELNARQLRINLLVEKLRAGSAR